jgi:hypothetical protein
MEQKFIKYIKEFLKKLEGYGFQIKTELSDGESYTVEYFSKELVLKIEKYFREFYVSLYKINKPDSGINLYNLVEYLIRNDNISFKPGNFLKEKDLEECYRKQFEEISNIFFNNYAEIYGFFNDENYELNMEEFKKYWKNKHPEFYKKA